MQTLKLIKCFEFTRWGRGDGLFHTLTLLLHVNFLPLIVWMSLHSRLLSKPQKKLYSINYGGALWSFKVIKNVRLSISLPL